MRILIAFLILTLSPLAHSSIATPVTFQAQVTGFDKNWVKLTANKKNFRVPRKIWERDNGTAKSGEQKVSMRPYSFAQMMLKYTQDKQIKK
jgi:hypothetical protein